MNPGDWRFFLNLDLMNKFSFRSSAFFALIALVCGITLTGCSTDFEVYEDPKEIRVVYGVLDPTDSVQYVRISTAYQVEGDALQYAAERDLSLSGLDVKMTGGGNTWIGEEVEVSKEPGIFVPNQFIYRFVTDGSDADHELLEEEVRYKLEVGSPDSPDYVTGETLIPNEPRIKGELNLLPGPGNSTCLPRLYLERRQNMFWSKSSDLNVNFEVRVYLNFEKNGERQEVKWGPSDLFNVNKRCNEGSANVCYQFAEKDLLRYFKNFMPEDGSNYTYNTLDSCVSNSTLLDLLPETMGFEVTAVDQFLSNYLIVNDPRNVDLTNTKPEYTNLTGNIDAVGVFGSKNQDIKWVLMRPCSEALLGLNGIQLPPGCDWD